MTINAFTKEKKMTYHHMSKEKESSTESSPLPTLGEESTQEQDITSTKQTKLSNLSKTRTKMPGSS